MTYEEARAFIEDSIQYGSILGLETVTELLRRLDNPQDKLKIIHVAGTNGKGSTIAFLASILAAQGYLVGRYISPAVFTYQERIQITRREKASIKTDYITEQGISEAIDLIKTVCEEMVQDGYQHPTSFEIETAMAMLYLVKEQVDFAVIEVGLGGRQDATNVLKSPVCCVITSISLDHMQYLGDTLAKIALEKAGIIKDRVPVVTSNTDSEILQVLQEVCNQKHTHLTCADWHEVHDVKTDPEKTQFVYQEQEYFISLLGEYQIANAVLALLTIRLLRQSGYNISENAVQDGLLWTGWSGRLEILSKRPYFMIDGAHNEDAALQLRKAILQYFPNQKLIYIMGVLADKDYSKILEITAPLATLIYTITPPNYRALASTQLAIEAKKYCSGTVVDAVTSSNAVKLAYQSANNEDVIIAFGSLSFLSEINEELNTHQ